MSPDEVIEAYVNDVVQRLPRADRNDVAAELHALLREELKGRAGDGEREDEVLALKLVREFGAPEDVAERYRQPGFVIVPATRSGRFAAFAFFGIALQWLITLPPVLRVSWTRATSSSRSANGGCRKGSSRCGGLGSW